jgi:hypothetical protein
LARTCLAKALPLSLFGRREDELGVGADGHFGRAHHQMGDLGQIGEGRHLGRVVLGHHHDRQIAREHRGLDHQALARQRLHVLPVGGGEHIRLGAVFDLHAKVLAAGEVEADLEVRVLLLEGQGDALEHLAQRGRREHGQLLRLGRTGPRSRACCVARHAATGDCHERATIHAGASVKAMPVRAVW